MSANVVTLAQLCGKPEFHPPARLERNTEAVVLKHLSGRIGASQFPVTTSDLTTLIERYAQELDLYADLSSYGDVEGATFFRKGAKPLVKIAAALSEARNENRLRSTLAHEFGHVWLHDSLFQVRSQDPLFVEPRQVMQVSKKDGFGMKGDLFEYQAWFVCGALLMPQTEVRRIVGDLAVVANCYSGIYVYSDLGAEVIASAARHFAVSSDLARIRLLRGKFITDKEPAPSLF
jgi:hypothetical protein